VFLLVNKTILLNLLYTYKIFIILNFVKMSGSSTPLTTLLDNDDVHTRTLPRIGGVHKDAEIWKFRITDWFRRERIITNESKFSYHCSL